MRPQNRFTFTINITTIKWAISIDIIYSLITRARNYSSLFRVFVSILSKENWVDVLSKSSVKEPG